MSYPDIPEYVLDQEGSEVRVGDKLAYSVLLGRSASLSIGTVLGFQYVKQVDGYPRNPDLKIKVQGFMPWGANWNGDERKPVLKKPGYLYADYRRFVKLPTPPCTCSSLSYKTDHRCGLHPDNRVLTNAQKLAFEQAFDARVEAGR